MPIFGPPDVEKLKTKGDVNGLIRVLDYQKDPVLINSASLALKQLGWSPDFATFKKALISGHNETVKLCLEPPGVVIDINKIVSYIFRGSRTSKGIDLCFKASEDFRAYTMILLGLDPWYHKDTQERIDLIHKVRESIQPKGEKLTELYVKVLTECGNEDYRALAAIYLGILNADFRLFEDRGLMNYPLLDYYRFATRYSNFKNTLSLNDFRALRRDSLRNVDPDLYVVEALRQALSDAAKIATFYPERLCPYLDIHQILLLSPRQYRTLFNIRRKGESKEEFFVELRAVETNAVELSLILIGDKESTRQIMEDCHSFGLNNLVYQLGWYTIAAELARKYVQKSQDADVALDILSMLKDVEMHTAGFTDDEKQMVEVATKKLKELGWLPTEAREEL